MRVERVLEGLCREEQEVACCEVGEGVDYGGAGRVEACCAKDLEDRRPEEGEVQILWC